jgi:methyl-accepting chemotaxis protein
MNVKQKKTAIILAASAAILVCIFSGFTAIRAHNRISLDGGLNSALADGKELISHILPPPGDMVEANLIITQLLDATDEEAARKHMNRYMDLKKDFEESSDRLQALSLQAIGLNERTAGELNQALEEARVPGHQFFLIGESEFLPALSKDNKANAKSIYIDKMKPLYEAQRLGLDKVEENANSHFGAITADIDSANDSLFRASCLAILSLSSLAILSAWYFFRVIRKAEDEAATVGARLVALDKVQATIEFTPQGEILTANENFLAAMGYSLEEIAGKHHKLFVAQDYANSLEYQQFWERLRGGVPQVAEFNRYGKGGKEVWIHASYNPILDQKGKVVRIVKFAVDVTNEKMRNANFEGQLQAINKSQAVIEFDLDGNILTANDNFLSTLGYRLDEVQGKHHRMFVDAVFVAGSDYKRFWDDLRAGRYQAGEFKRFGKGDKVVWIQASYNPIFDLHGKPVKVVKYATDITASKEMELAIKERQKQDEREAEVMKSKVAEILEVAEKVSRRDYSRKLTVCGDDGIGQLGQGLTSFFEEKQRTELAEQDRNEKERAAAEETSQKVTVILDVVNAVASGDFTVNIPDLGDDAVGQVAQALGTAVASIKKALSEVNDVAGTVASAAQQLTEASTEITSGAQSQASSLEETASSLEEITSTVKQNTDNAQQARQLANGSKDIAERGGAVVSNAVDAMGEINQSSKKIADIITTIDEIAFQTNLLALNAAVEAARAGEQGRGFAVVAAEVRNLAQRSASAAKEIKTLIQDSVRKVEVGTDLVNRSGQTLSEIVTSVKRVTDIVSEIAAASKEQLTGIEQVNLAVSQMDRVTQGNAAQTEEMSGTASALLANATQLSQLVGGFRLDDDSSPVSKRTPAPVAVTKKNRTVALKAKGKAASVIAPLTSFNGNSASGMTLEF